MNTSFPGPRGVRGPIVTTAAVTALVTSVATAGLTWAVAHQDPPGANVAGIPSLVGEKAGAEIGLRGPGRADGADTSTDGARGTKARHAGWTAVAEEVRPSVVAIAVMGASGSGEGSGVVVDADGNILTNNHVVAGAQEIRVTFWDGRVHEATVVGTDPTTDLAVIALTDPPDDLVVAELGDSGSVRVGDPVMAVGNPLGLDSTVTTGIVSALDRPVTTGSSSPTEVVVTNAIQVDAAINPGNSGGPLFDADGRVIGVTSSIATISRTGSQAGSIGLGFAIPVNLADAVAQQLVADGTVAHAYLGVYLSDGTATVDGTTRLGAVVEDIAADAPAADADLRPGDVVVSVDGEPVGGALSLTAFVREHTVGDVVTLGVVRDGRTRDVEVRLTARQDEARGPSPDLPG